MKRLAILISLFLVCGVCAIGQNMPIKWLHIYRYDAAFTSIPMPDITGIEFYGTEDLARKIVVSTTSTKESIPLSSVEKCAFGPNVPWLEITTDTYIDEIASKEEYMAADFTLHGYGIYDDVQGRLNIRGRGNSTWGLPKKPYRLNFSSKISLCGLKKAKNYALIAHYIDPTAMTNPIALKTAQLLEMPYTNHAVPVNVTLNGRYRGSYMLTEKIGINGASVDIDEAQSILFELDANYDEDYKFKSNCFGLPVMVKDPDMTDDLFAKWKADFNQMEKYVYLENAEKVAEMLDFNSLAKFALVMNLTVNRELNWPKSTYIYKTEGGKYCFGPMWDFDWAYGFYPQTGEYLIDEARCVLYEAGQEYVGGRFFRKLFKMTAFRTEYEAVVTDFLKNKLYQLLEYIDSYAAAIEPSMAWNATLYSQTRYFKEHIDNLRAIVEMRATLIGNAANNYYLY